MAIKATLQADFSQFNDAVNKAESELKSFEGNANKVGSSLNRMVDNFSGRKLIQDATLMAQAVEKIQKTGGLTASELQRVATTAQAAAEKMRAMGIDVPPKIQALANQVQPLPGIFSKVQSAVTAVGGALGIAFTGTAILSGIKNQISAAIQYADVLTNLSVSTGVSVQGLQRLESIGATSGVSMETLARAVNALNRNLDDKDAQDALRRMGLDYEALRRLSPEEQFLKIARAVSEIKDPVEKANAGAALFNRTWDAISPAINKNIDSILKQTKTMSDGQIKALDDLGDEWDTFFLTTSRGMKGFIADIVAGDRAMNDAEWIWNRKPVPLELPKVNAPGARTNRGPFVNDVDPEMISNLKVYGMTLEETAKSALKVAEAEKAAAKSREALNEMSKAGLGPQFAWQEQLGLTKFKADQLAVSERQLFETLGTLDDFVGNQLTETISRDYSVALTKADIKTREFGESVAKGAAESITLRDTLDLMATGFSNLGNIGGDGLSKITRGVGSVVAATNLAFDAVKTLSAAFGALSGGGGAKASGGGGGAVGAIGAVAGAAGSVIGAIAGVASLATGIAAIVPIAMAAASAVKKLWSAARGGEEGIVVNPARDKWFSGRGVQDIGDQLAPFMDGESARKMIEAVFNSKTQKDFERTSGAIDDILRGGGGITSRDGSGFAKGTGGKYLDFGAGTPVMLHGRERVMTEAEGRTEVGLLQELSGLRREMAQDRRALPHLIAVAMQDAMVRA